MNVLAIVVSDGMALGLVATGGVEIGGGRGKIRETREAGYAWLARLRKSDLRSCRAGADLARVLEREGRQEEDRERLGEVLGRLEDGWESREIKEAGEFLEKLG